MEIIKKYKNISFSSRFNGEINKRMEKTENKNPGGGRQQLLQIRFWPPFFPKVEIFSIFKIFQKFQSLHLVVNQNSKSI